MRDRHGDEDRDDGVQRLLALLGGRERGRGVARDLHAEERGEERRHARRHPVLVERALERLHLDRCASERSKRSARRSTSPIG